ncbi:tyrosinase family oxidase copper chaperone [Streptomyces sp. NPDC052396]|uniref:tyrosinase family oxidase copper chaperone n=1 Tax=Streptomyces sp. NPDC052396 TaxID=3365689 RepID=UPI0037D34F7D
MKPTRRLTLTTLTAAAITALAIPAASAATAHGPTAVGRAATATRHCPPAFDEIYHDRHITGAPHGDGSYTASIDGRELHLIPNADGTWSSVINAYQSFATPLAATRAAVDALDGADLN